MIFIAFLMSCEKDNDNKELKKYGSLEGTIKNEFGQAIDSAIIEVGTLSTKSNSIGKYKLEKIEINEYSVSISKSHFLTKIEKIIINENETNILDLILMAGETFLNISDTIINLNAKSGSFNIKILSNSNWIIQNASSWISNTVNNGGGNDTVSFNYNVNLEMSRRSDTIHFISGSLNKSLIINQGPPIKIKKCSGILGNNVTGRKDSVYILFNKPIIVEKLESNWIYCISEMNYRFTDNNCGIKFSFSCAKLGGKYPFSISLKDNENNSYNEEFEVTFYNSKLDIEGFITDILLINNDKEALISTFSPSRIIKYSIELDKFLQSYDLSSIISPIKLSFNPFNSKIYIMGSDPNATYRHTTVDRPDVFTLDIQTNEISKAFTVTSNDFYPINIPYNIGFTKSGIGIMLLKSNETSGCEWKLIDCSNNDSIYYYPGYNGWSDENNFNNVHMNFDNTKLYLTKPYGSCNYGVFDGYTHQLSILRPSSITRGYAITADRKTERFYARQLYDQFIIDLNGNMSQISYLDSRHAGSADFNYQENEDNLIYICEAQSFDYPPSPASFYIMNYSNGSIIMLCDIIDGFERFVTTIDGIYAIAFRQNSDISSSIFIFRTNYLKVD